MGGASPYRARFMGIPPCGQPRRDDGGAPLGDGEKYYGLVNVSNTCYVNSVLQALYFCAAFRRNAIRHLAEDRDGDLPRDTLLAGVAELFAQIEAQKRPMGCIVPRRFLAQLRKASNRFCTSEHQDAHEFMQFLLNDIAEYLVKREREKRKAISGDSEDTQEEPRTWVHELFQGLLVNQMKCLCCESVTVRRETYLDLSVDIERNTSIAACLRAFESTELLRAGNKFFCDACACLQEAEKRLRIWQLPSVLLLHLKRFKYVEPLGRCCRLPYRVIFPLQLRVVEPRQPVRGVQADDGSCGPEDATAEDGEQSPSASSRLYELRSVVVHIGQDPTRGHYVTIVRSGDRWVLLDDAVVKEVEPELLRSFYGTPWQSNDRRDVQGLHYGQDHDHGGRGWGDGRVGGGFTHSLTTSSYDCAPEGTCCGYLLIYETVDGSARESPLPPDSDNDMAAAATWVSEERHFPDSESDDSGEEWSGSAPARAPQSEDGADQELVQDFEQRCNGRAAAPRQRASAVAAAAAAAANALNIAMRKQQEPLRVELQSQGQQQVRQQPRPPSRSQPQAAPQQQSWPQSQQHSRPQSRPQPRVSTGSDERSGPASLAWTAADEAGAISPSSDYSNGGVTTTRTLGSVVPVGTPGTVSPSRVNVTTISADVECG